MLDDDDEGWAHDVAMNRHAEDVMKGARDQHGDWNKADGGKLHLQGARAELYAARFFDVEWAPKNFANRHEPDVADLFDVRATGYRNGGMLLHPGDPDRRPVVLVITGDRFTLPGWCWGEDGKAERYWWTGGKSPCYRVPQAALHPPAALRAIIAESEERAGREHQGHDAGIRDSPGPDR
jgi:hypothetical protein